MIDTKTGQFCIVCSYSIAHDYWRNDAIALHGLPALNTIQNTPLTDQLCGGHRQLVTQQSHFTALHDDMGAPATYETGVLQERYAGALPRPQHSTKGIGVYSQDDILSLLQYMEKRLYMLQMEVDTGWRLWHHPGDTGEPVPLTASEVVERAAWRRWIEDYLPDFLYNERYPESAETAYHPSIPADLPPPQVPQNSGSWTLADFPFNDSIGPADPDDRISGEE